MPQFLKNKRLIILLICTIILVALVGYSLNRKNQLTSPEQFIKDTVAIVQSVFEKPAQYVSGFVKNIIDLRDTYEENKVLKARLDEYTELSVEVSELKKENEELKNTVGIQESLRDYEPIPATVIMRNPDQWHEIISINRGKEHGIEENMAVITADGLIGKVKSASKFTSTVELISSSTRTNRISAIIQDDENIFGLIEGYDIEKKLLLFKHIPYEAEVKEKQKVITSGLGGAFAKGLVIGEVVEVKPDKNGLTKIAYVKPAANFTDLNYVMVVKRTAPVGTNEGGE